MGDKEDKDSENEIEKDINYNKEQDPFTKLLNRLKTDVLIIKHAIYDELFDKIVNEVVAKYKEKKLSDKLSLFLVTSGGDANIAIKIVNFLQSIYKNGYSQYVISRCKSAGTIICCGATDLVFVKYFGEIGPLDAQLLKKEDFKFQQQSSLNVFSCLQKLQTDLMIYFIRLVSTEYSPDRAIKMCDIMSKNMYEPICRQINPYQLGEISRAMEIAKKYCNIANSKYKILLDDGIEQLVNGYPNHGFVIDAKEALKSFKKEKIKEEDFLDYQEILNIINNIKEEMVLFYGYDK